MPAHASSWLSSTVWQGNWRVHMAQANNLLQEELEAAHVASSAQVAELDAQLREVSEAGSMDDAMAQQLTADLQAALAAKVPIAVCARSLTGVGHGVILLGST